MKTAVQISLQTEQYRCLELLALAEQCSVSQMAQRLLEERLARQGQSSGSDELTGVELAALATQGGAFDWLADEPDLYDDSCGEPI